MIKSKTTDSLSTHLSFSTYNAESEHNIKIEVNGKLVFGKAFAKKKQHDCRITDNFEYVRPGLNIVKILWDGDQECENKFLKIIKFVVNDQIIPNYSAMIIPLENEYIKDLKSTEQGMTVYKKKILYNGNYFGWYGTYRFQFVVDPHLLVQSQPSYSAIRGTGIKPDVIFTEKGLAKHTRVQKL